MQASSRFALLAKEIMRLKCLLTYSGIYHANRGNTPAQKSAFLKRIINENYELSWLIVKVFEGYPVIKTNAPGTYPNQVARLTENGFRIISASETKDEKLINVFRTENIDLLQPRVVIGTTTTLPVIEELISFYLSDEAVEIFIKEEHLRFYHSHKLLGEIFRTAPRNTRSERFNKWLMSGQKRGSIEKIFRVSPLETGRMNSYAEDLNMRIDACLSAEYPLAYESMDREFKTANFYVRFSKGEVIIPARLSFKRDFGPINQLSL
jgi:hypothetical protein